MRIFHIPNGDEMGWVGLGGGIGVLYKVEFAASV